MLQTLKVLKGAVALHEFTVDEVAAYTGVSRSTVRTVLRRHEDWFPVLGTEATGRRGGQWAIYQASDEAAEQVAQLLDRHRDAVGADVDPPPGMPEPAPLEARLGAVEHALLAPNLAQKAGSRAPLTVTAAEAIRSLDDLRTVAEASSDRRLVIRFAAAQLLARTVTTDWAHATDDLVAELSQQWTGLLDDLETVGLGALAHRITGWLRSNHAQGVLADEASVPAVADRDLIRSPGRPATRYAVGVELLPYMVVAVLVNEHGDSVDSYKATFDDMNPHTAAKAITTAVDKLSQVASVRASASGGLALGVQVGGPVDSEAGVVHYLSKAPPTGWPESVEFRWRNVELGIQLTKATGLPTVIENDANAFAMYELVYGIGRETDDLVVMLVREGVGGSLVKGGQIFPGPMEVGNLAFHSSGFRANDAGLYGTIESAGGTMAIVDAVREQTGQAVSDISRAAELADEDAEAVAPFRESGVAIKTGIASLVSLSGPDAVVLYAPPVMLQSGRPASDAFLAEVEAFRPLVPYEVYRKCSLTLRSLGPYPGAMGAAALCLERVFGVSRSMLTESLLAGEVGTVH